MATARNSLVLAVACLLAALGLIAPATTAADVTVRGLAEARLQEPALSLAKGVTEVGGKIVPGGPASGVIAGGGELVKYELHLENSGTLDAEEAEVWDQLPQGVDCADVVLPAQTAPQAATCAAGTIKWTGVAIPIGALTALSYEVTLPTAVAPGHAFVNHAGVTHYRSGVGTSEEFEYVPEGNIDKELTVTNVGPLLAEAEVKTTPASLEVEATTGVTQPGNLAGQATIGEIVDYKVTATIPANSKVYGTPVLIDELPANLEKVGIAGGELDGAILPAEGVTLEQLPAGAEVRFNGPYPETVSAQAHTLVLTLETRVRNVAVNKRGVTITNGASFEFADLEGAGPTVLGESVGTSVVEPDIEVTTKLLPEGRAPIVEPGEVVEYEAEVSNQVGAATANEVTVLATVPAGMVVADAGGGTVEGSTVVWHPGAIAPAATEGIVYKLEVVDPATASTFAGVVDATTQSLFDEPGGVVPPGTRLATFEEGGYVAAKEGYESEAETTVDLAVPELAVGVAPEGGSTVAGTDDAYVITVSNGGTGIAHEVDVRNVLSKGQEFVGPATAEPSAGFVQKSVEANTPGAGETTVVWTIAAVSTGAPVTIQVPIRTPASLGDGVTVTDRATVGSPQQAAEPSDEGSFVVHRMADLAIEKTAVQEDVNAGEAIEYDLRVENHGPSDASGIVVSDGLPGSTIFKGSGPGCVQAAGTVTCKLSELKVGEAHTFQVRVQVKSGTAGAIENTATVKGDQPGPPGGGPTESTAQTQVAGLAVLSIGVVGPERPVLLGDDFTYEITVENDGPSDAVRPKVEDRLPPQVKFLAATPSVGTCDEAPGGFLTCNLKRMLPHAKATVLVTVAAVEVGSFTNLATASSETSPGPKVGGAPTEIVPAADLAIAAAMGEAQAGKPLTYTLSVTNHGPSPSNGVTVTDTLPADTGFKAATGSQGACAAAGRIVTCRLGDLAAGGTAQVSITVEVAATATGSLRNVATVGGPDADPEESNNQSAVEGPIAPWEASNLKVAMTVGPPTPVAGKPFAYHVSIGNVSGGEARDVKVIGILSGSARIVSVDSRAGHCAVAGTKVNCTVPSIPVGRVVHLTYSALAPAAGPLRSTVRAEAANGEKSPGNNTAARVVQVKDPQAHYSLAASASRGVVAGGEKVGFTITVSNGPVAMADARICDRLPPELVFVEAPGARYVHGEACWTRTSLAARETLRLRLVARAVKGYKGRRARNVAMARAANAGRLNAAAAVWIMPSLGGRGGGVTG
ncbi:MAG: DUF11 domain-containing protein [Actinobacteria bacterium]|nr:DUF11 domain-containing protein [Actinomycetota bacterium]